MSRICVKNLPKYVAEDRLREFFSQKGEVTDAKLLRTPDGKSRQFAFVGFRTEQEANEAIKYFNRSFLDTFRITCELARKIGDPDTPRPWSRHSMKKQEKLGKEDDKVTSSKNTKIKESKVDKKHSVEENENDDPLLQEFLQVMQPRSKSKMWANDTIGAPSLEESKKETEKKFQREKESKTQMNSDNVESDEDDDKENESLESHKDEKPKSFIHDDVVTDMDYFKRRVKKDWSDSESSNEDGDDDSDADGGSDESDENSNEDDENSLRKSNDGLDALKHDDNKKVVGDRQSRESGDEMLESGDPSSNEDEKEVLESGRLFIRNLPYTTTEEELGEHFGKYGNVSQVHIVVDKETKRSKGIAYVLYSLPESAARALEELDSSIFQGRLLHVMPAKQKFSSEKQEVNGSGKLSSQTFKQKRVEERKASEASGNIQAWNTLFMRPDTVVENIARRLGVSKSDLLDKEASDLAVRIAWGETKVIAETKQCFAKAGINIASLEELAAGKTDSVKRSNHVILVKNLPYSSSETELANMFGKFGSLDKVILPPTKTLALVVFLEPAEARAAFRGLSYKRYKDAPLYLEWAPGNILDQTDDSKNSVIVGEQDVKKVLLEQQVEGTIDADVDPDRVESRSLYVKNLNFKTADESLKKHFSENMKDGRILSVRVKKHTKNGKTVSMGFGFIEFDSVDTAVNVCKDLQGTVLDGHALILQLCHAKKDEQVLKKVDKDKSSTKLLVRNVAFEATEKDLRQLFNPFGQIKSLRLPMRFGSHRGFAFVEFVTKQEAQNAFEALSSTHLYGRHLVLERAKEGESLEELRARTAAQFAGEENGFQTATKLSKKRKHMAVLDERTVKFERIAD
ncbi:multiple RNA-binding domain-containing protein 1 [Ipomoea triloba]|uniref:multiple RNA-binding domain-containing protein 1 n=1 Tax=Ipomoea triloba TaxID=35885 RepID=UPI00125E2289|nr:multiple RNA-binding domain-containing protein 1 [Ipomoea triloba]XP_031092092.1 multiple RNA-binding domain-containing protein 1 [Ipomoea triloba]XP_031092093.1 multiple RNA-binding domain-containing protein 1 [Ipomoea triloba]